MEVGSNQIYYLNGSEQSTAVWKNGRNGAEQNRTKGQGTEVDLEDEINMLLIRMGRVQTCSCCQRAEELAR